MTDRETINRTIDQAWPFAPFEAWDLIAQERVVVIGWYDTSHYRLSTGTIVHLSTITNNIPAWLADARDEADTQRCALGEGVQ